MILQFFLYAVLLFFLMRFINWVVKILPQNYSYRKILIKVLPVIELTFWVVLIFFAARGLLKEAYHYEIVVFVLFIILIGFISWFFIRDFIAGIFIRSEYLINLNQKIKVFDTEGHIKKIGYRSLEIKSESGETVRIPYSKLSNTIITFPAIDTESFYKHSFKMEIRKDKPYTHYLEYLRFTLLNISWVIMSKEPEINLLDTTGDFYIFKIEFYALNEQHARRSELQLKKHFEQ